MTTTKPTGLMFACITVGDTAAAETAVCAEHRVGFVPAPSFGDVEDVTLQDCSGNEALSCSVCDRTADEVAAEPVSMMVPGAAITPECGCRPLPHVLAPTNTACGVQCCDECAPEGFGDLQAAGLLAERVGGVVRFYAEVPEHVAACPSCSDSDGGCDAGRVAVQWAGPGDVRIIVSGTDPWVEVNGEPVAWAEPSPADAVRTEGEQQ